MKTFFLSQIDFVGTCYFVSAIPHAPHGSREIVHRRVQVGLGRADREAMLWALDEAPTAVLAELRAVLVREHEWRVRVGLV